MSAYNVEHWNQASLGWTRQAKEANNIARKQNINRQIDEKTAKVKAETKKFKLSDLYAPAEAAAAQTWKYGRSLTGGLTNIVSDTALGGYGAKASKKSQENLVKKKYGEGSKEYKKFKQKSDEMYGWTLPGLFESGQRQGDVWTAEKRGDTARKEQKDLTDKYAPSINKFMNLDDAGKVKFLTGKSNRDQRAVKYWLREQEKIQGRKTELGQLLDKPGWKAADTTADILSQVLKYKGIGQLTDPVGVGSTIQNPLTRIATKAAVNIPVNVAQGQAGYSTPELEGMSRKKAAAIDVAAGAITPAIGEGVEAGVKKFMKPVSTVRKALAPTVIEKALVEGRNVQTALNKIKKATTPEQYALLKQEILNGDRSTADLFELAGKIKTGSKVKSEKYLALPTGEAPGFTMRENLETMAKTGGDEIPETVIKPNVAQYNNLEDTISNATAAEKKQLTHLEEVIDNTRKIQAKLNKAGATEKSSQMEDLIIAKEHQKATLVNGIRDRIAAATNNPDVGKVVYPKGAKNQFAGDWGRVTSVDANGEYHVAMLGDEGTTNVFPKNQLKIPKETVDSAPKQSYPAFDESVVQSSRPVKLADTEIMTEPKIIKVSDAEQYSGQYDANPIYIDKFKKSIASGEPMEPITIEIRNADSVVNGDVPDYRILDGHHRLLAAKELGYQEVPVRYIYDTEMMSPDELADAKRMFGESTVPVKGGVDTFKFQDANQEKIVKRWNDWRTPSLDNPQPGGYNAMTLRETLEGTGDIFRESTKKNADPAYIAEKVKRLNNLINEPNKMADYSDNKKILSELRASWVKQPANTAQEKLARDLNLAVIDGDFNKAQKLVNQLSQPSVGGVDIPDNLGPEILGPKPATAGDVNISFEKTAELDPEDLKAFYRKNMFDNGVNPAQVDNLMDHGTTSSIKLEDNWVPPAYDHKWQKIVRGIGDKIGEKAQGSKFLKHLTTQEGRPNDYWKLYKERAYEIRGSLDQIKNNFIRPLENLSQEEKISVGNMLRGLEPVSGPNAELINATKADIARLGNELVTIEDDMVARGVIDESSRILTRETFEKNMYNYLRDYYRGGAKQTFPIPTRPIKLETGMGKRKLTAEEWGQRALQFEGVGKKEIANYSAEELSRIGLEAKRAYGWVEEADLGLQRTYKDMIGTVTNYKYFNSIIDNKGWWSDVETDGMKLLPTDKRLGPLSGKYVLDPIAGDLKSMIKEPDFIDKYFSPINGWWKMGKTAFSPATAMRNAYSGTIVQNDMAGAPVWEHGKLWGSSVRDYVKKTGRFNEATRSGLFGGDYFSQEVDDQILKSIEMSDNPTKATFAAIGDKVKDVGSYYQKIDHLNRMYLFNYARDNGASIVQARNYANKWQLDYTFVPKIVQEMRRLPLLAPFASFKYLMAPRIIEFMANRPWAFAKYPLIFGAISAASAKAIGMSEEEADAQKPENISWGALMPWRDSRGKPVWLDLSYTLPFGKYGLDPKTADLFGGGPVGTIYNAASNWDPYFQDTIRKEYKNPMENALGTADYVARGVLPNITYQAPQSIGKSVIKTMKGEEPTRAIGPELLNSLFGIRTASPSKYTMEKILKKAGVTVSSEHTADFNELFKPKNERTLNDNWVAQNLVKKVNDPKTDPKKKTYIEKLIKGFGIKPEEFGGIDDARKQRLRDARKKK